MADRRRFLLTAVVVALASGVLAVVLPGILTPPTGPPAAGRSAAPSPAVTQPATPTAPATPAPAGEPATQSPTATDDGTSADVDSPRSESYTPVTYLLLNGRRLTPQGAQVTLGNFPSGGAVTADGRFLWTVSAGFGADDIRIVDTATRRVCQVIPVPGASGGIALDSARRLAYVSGLTYSRWWPSMLGTLGFAGNCVLVYGWDAVSGQAHLLRTISVGPPAGAPPVQAFAPTRAVESTATNGWPQRLAVSPDGSRLLVPLNLADSAALVDLNASDTVRYVATGTYPFAAAILPDSRVGLVSNEASGTLSVIDLVTGLKLRDIAVGPPALTSPGDRGRPRREAGVRRTFGARPGRRRRSGHLERGAHDLGGEERRAGHDAGGARDQP